MVGTIMMALQAMALLPMGPDRPGEQADWLGVARGCVLCAELLPPVLVALLHQPPRRQLSCWEKGRKKCLHKIHLLPHPAANWVCAENVWEQKDIIKW